MADLLKLAERVEALSGADMTIDREISEALNIWWMPDTDCVGPWTASLDAAMTLVERPAWIRIDEWPDEYNATSASVQPIRDPQVASHCARAATPALALCAAALRARAANG